MFNNYADATRKILGFDKYENISAKDNERMWRASEVVIDYDLSIISHLDRTIVKSKSNKQKLASVKGTFNLVEITSAKTVDGRLCLDEAYMAIVLVWSECDLHTSDDTDVFVLL